MVAPLHALLKSGSSLLIRADKSLTQSAVLATKTQFLEHYKAFIPFLLTSVRALRITTECGRV